MTANDIWKVIVPIITFLLGILYSFFTGRRQQKLNNRSFPYVDEIYLPFDLSDLKVLENTKLYLTGDYSELMNSRHVDKRAEIVYVKIANYGPGHMVNCDLKIKVVSTDGTKNWNFDVHIPLIIKDEYVLIPVVNKEMNHTMIILGQVQIAFRTYSNERMLYTQTLNKINETTTDIKEKLIVYKFFKHEKVYEYKGRNSLFVYLNSMYKKRE